MHIERDEAAETLGHIGSYRREAAAKAAMPRAYYLLLGTGLALVCLSAAFFGVVRWSVAGPGMAMIVLSAAWHGARGTIPSLGSVLRTFWSRHAWVTWTMLAIALGSFIASATARSIVVSIPAAAAVLIVFAVLGPRWDREWVDQAGSPR